MYDTAGIIYLLMGSNVSKRHWEAIVYKTQFWIWKGLTNTLRAEAFIAVEYTVSSEVTLYKI